MNLKEAFELQPRLEELYQDICKERHSIPPRQRERAWYRNYKQKMLRLIGFSSTTPALESCQVYTQVYGKLYDILHFVEGSTNLEGE